MKPPDTALVLTAGLGSRLRPLSSVRAKAAVPIAGTPLVCRILSWLAGQGIRRAVLNLHHRPETITREVGDGAGLGLEIRYSWEPSLLGSAGGPRHALDLMDAERFFIINGDTLTDLDLRSMAGRHDQLGALVTMALIENPAPAQYGGVAVDTDGWIQSFTRPGGDVLAYHFIGVQVVEAEAFADLEDGEPAETVNGIYRDLLVAAEPRLAGFLSSARFHDVGTPRDYLETVFALTAPGEVAAISPMSIVDPTATVTHSVVWDHVTIGAGATLTDCIVADDVRIPPGARLARCVVVTAGAHEVRSGDITSHGLLIAPLSLDGPCEPPQVELHDLIP